MTKIITDSKGLMACAEDMIYYYLTEPAEPNLVCEGEIVFMFSRNGKKWEPCVIVGDEYICPNGAETKRFWQIVKPMQEALCPTCNEPKKAYPCICSNSFHI